MAYDTRGTDWGKQKNEIKKNNNKKLDCISNVSRRVTRLTAVGTGAAGSWA